MSISDLVVVLYFSFQFVQYKCRIKIQQTVDYMFAYRERERGGGGCGYLEKSLSLLCIVPHRGHTALRIGISRSCGAPAF
jgi:hypothetical protein